MSSSQNEEVFCNRMTEVVSSGHTLAGLSLGVKLGLFKSLAEEEGSITPQRLADKTQCKERYVREWLNHMVVCDVVDVDDTGKLFTLPSYRRKALVKDGEAVVELSSMFAYMLLPHDELINCFKVDGPTGLSFDKVMPMVKEQTPYAEKAQQTTYVENMLQSHPAMESILESGAKFLEVGCGEGQMLLFLAKRFPKSQFVGIDLSMDMLARAITDQKLMNITNVEFLEKDASDLPTSWDNTFDYIFICHVLHDLAYPDKVLDALYKYLKQNGKFFVVEIYTSSNIYKTNQDATMKEIAQICYIGGIYHCLPASMYFPNSAALGVAPGVECLVELVTKAQFKCSFDPKPCGGWSVFLMFEK